MAMIKAETAQGFSQLPALRQLGLMIGLAASVAIGVAVVLWSQTPNYSLLYGSLSEKDASAVMEALQQSDIPYKIDDKSGALLVPAKSVHEARLKLASSGLPKGNAVGLEVLQKEQELGTSQFVEQARYQHALEIELARSISSLRSVSSARVHLAIPKRSVFVREQQHPTASVVLDLYSGRQLEEGQIAAIVHLVASSISNLDPGKVTVVDQTGRLLTQNAGDRQLALTSSQFDYTRRLENNYIQRIEGLLSPIVGNGKVRAQVVADIDFTRMERTRESYNPDLPALRAEEVVEESNRSGAPSGVPGALSNQPPEAGTTDVEGAGDPAAQAGAAVANGEQSAGSSSRRSTRNYELDKTISHTRSSGGRIQRLSVAVVLDDRQVVQDDGTIARTPLTDKEIEQITALVKDAVGFDLTRGDTVNVINQAFQQPQAPEPLPEPALWEQPWVMDLGKQALGGLAVLLLVFGVLRPVLKSLAEKGVKTPMRAFAVEGGGEVGEDQLSITGGGQQPRLPQANQYEQQLNTAKSMANQDPGRVAQVVKNWVASDG